MCSSRNYLHNARTCREKVYIIGQLAHAARWCVYLKQGSIVLVLDYDTMPAFGVLVLVMAQVA